MSDFSIGSNPNPSSPPRVGRAPAVSGLGGPSAVGGPGKPAAETVAYLNGAQEDVARVRGLAPERAQLVERLRADLKSDDYRRQSRAREELERRLDRGEFWVLDALTGDRELRHDLDRLREKIVDHSSPESAAYRVEASLAEGRMWRDQDPSKVRAAFAQAAELALAGDPRAILALARVLVNRDGLPRELTALRDQAAEVLEKAAAAGHAAAVVDALLSGEAESDARWRSEHPITPRNHDGRSLAVLGKAASLLPAEDRERLQQVLSRLSEAVRANHSSSRESTERRVQRLERALEGLEALAERLTPEAAEVLAEAATDCVLDRSSRREQPSQKAARILARALPHLPEDERRALVDKVGSKLADTAKSMHMQRGGREIGELARYATAEQVQSIVEGVRRSQNADDVEMGARALASILTRCEDASVRQLAAQALLDRQLFLGRLPSEVNQALAEYATQSGQRSLKNQAADRMSYNWFTDTDLAIYEQTYERLMAAEMRRAVEQNPDGPMAKLARLLAARAMASDPKNENGKHVNVKEVDRQIRELVEGPLKLTLEQIHGRARREARMDVSSKGFEDYLTSDEFFRRLELLEPAERQKLIEKELAKLNVANPEAVPRVMQALLARDVGNQTAERLAAMEPAEIAEDLNYFAEALGLAKLTASQAAQLAKALKDLGHSKDLAQAGPKLLQHFQRMANNAQSTFRGPELAGLIQWVEKAIPHIATIAAGVSLMSLATNDLKTPQDKARFAHDLLTVGGHADDAARLPGISRVVGRYPSFASKLAATSKVLGPLATVVGVGLDTWSAIDSARVGDTGNAVGSGVSAVGGAVMLGSLAAGPAAPLVFAAGAILSLAGLGIGLLFGDSAEIRGLKDMGIYQDAD